MPQTTQGGENQQQSKGRKGDDKDDPEIFIKLFRIDFSFIHTN
jgi:hypothetical protein